MERRNTKFIVIEGIDGAGKSTQIKMLQDVLDKQDRQCYFTREATDGPIGSILRNTYLSGNRKCDERVINILYAADRLDHITNETDGILQYLINGFDVFSDRYYLSSMAYNNYMMLPDVDKLTDGIYNTTDMNYVNMDLLKPDLTIYIDLDPKNAMSRLKSRDDDQSIYETEEKLQKIHEAYDIAIDILWNEFDEKIIRVDGNRSAEEIHQDILKIVNEILED